MLQVWLLEPKLHICDIRQITLVESASHEEALVRIGISQRTELPELSGTNVQGLLNESN